MKKSFSVVEFMRSFLLFHFGDLNHQFLGQMGEGCVYMCSEVRHTPLSRGSVSHQRLTSTSSSGHVQRHNAPQLLLLQNWH